MGLLDVIETTLAAVTEPAIGVIDDAVASVLGAVGVTTDPVSTLLPGVLPAADFLSPTAQQVQVGGGGGLVSTPGQIAANMTGFGGGNGKEATRTIVQTVNLLTGKIVRFKILPGSPHLMNSEVSAAKRVFKISSKLHARMPRRTVKESQTKKLTDAAIAAATANVTCPNPKPPC